MDRLRLIDKDEQLLRITHVTSGMKALGADSVLLCDNASLYYLTGRVFLGYVYVTVDGSIKCFVMRPVELEGEDVVYIRKPEEIPSHLAAVPSQPGLELDTLAYSTVQRLARVLDCEEPLNASAVMRMARSIKTACEIKNIKQSGVKQTHVYRQIPRLYQPGMSDIEFQIEIERACRLEGCLGQFRISGDSMELFMGNIIAGENADAPSPYDFAMGGAGMDPSLPVGADGTLIKPGMTVMVDVNGNFTGYMTDMTRVFALGEIAPEAVKAHECSRRIHRELAAMGVPGTEAKALYNRAVEIAAEEGLERYFMGHRQHAKFVGHGLGIEINELPVIAPRSRDIITLGQVIALEPKFVIPGTGAVGVENTYLVTENGWECLTNAPEEILSLS